MAKKDGPDLLKQVPLFEGLSKSELKHISHEMREQWFNPGQTIVAEGQPGGAFYLITEGRAKVMIKGKKKASLEPGNFFGEMSVIDKSPRSATIEAETRVRTLAITSYSFMALLEEHWPLTKKVLLELVGRVRELES